MVARPEANVVGPGADPYVGVPWHDAAMRLRPVTLDDVSLYERLRCDVAMMAELGGPLAREGIPDKVASDVADVELDRAWIFVVEEEGGAAGHVCIWDHEEDGERINEIGWMVLPEFQGRGLGREAARALLDRARAERRWDVVHAYPAVSNAPSNAICRALGFERLEARDIEFQGRTLRSTHWRIDLRNAGAPALVPPTARCSGSCGTGSLGRTGA
jgi:RimJ/RimL family protein N-acetyltransferase